MATFTIQPCKLRDDRFVPIKGQEPIIVEWAELCKRVAPSRTPRARGNLRHLREGAFVGVTKHRSGRLSNFVFANQDSSNSAKFLVRKDPNLESKIISLYRIVELDWGHKFEEWDAVKAV